MWIKKRTEKERQDQKKIEQKPPKPMQLGRESFAKKKLGRESPKQIT